MTVTNKSKLHDNANHAGNVADASTNIISSSSGEARMMRLSEIQLTDRFHFRGQIHDKTVDRYADGLRQYIEDKGVNNLTQCKFFPIHVFFDGNLYHLVAGWHRCRASQKVGLAEVPCVVLSDREEAVQIGLTSNATHGLQLCKSDLVHSIRLALAEFNEWSSRLLNLLAAAARTLTKLCERKIYVQLNRQRLLAKTVGSSAFERTVVKVILVTR